MKFVADESVDAIVDRLRLHGHEVDYVAELAPSLSDDEVLDRANNQGALLVTEDKDFGELVYRLRRVHGGAVLVRLSGVSSPLKASIVADVIRERGSELQNAFAVISPASVRIRH
jgi:predicted nuclease of predicted toxin-antitoxin system